MTARAPRRDPWAELDLVHGKADASIVDIRDLGRKLDKLSDRTREGFQHVNLRLDTIDKRLDAVGQLLGETKSKASGAHRLGLDHEQRLSAAEARDRELAAQLAIAQADYTAKLKASAEPLDVAEARQLKAEMYRTFRGHVPNLVRVAVGVVIIAAGVVGLWIQSCRPGGF